MEQYAGRIQMAEKLSGKKMVIIVANEFEDIELLYPLLRLSEEGAEIVVVPVPLGFHPRPFVEGKPVTGRFGHPVPIPVMPEGERYRIGKIEEIDVARIDCLLIPGGFSPDYLRRHKATLDLVRHCHQQGKLLTAICHAPWILISAGIMAGRRATGLAVVRDDLVNAGAKYEDLPAVRDGHLITTRAPNDLPEFCLEIIQALAE
jgi:protease I